MPRSISDVAIFYQIVCILNLWTAAHWAKYTINQLSSHLKIYTNYGQNL